ncbi:MAG: PDZ domain-containing protein [Alphaproteobacteria bacterium]|nr:PDZ domain-containing protein [Alphaproteobacteria bacterium]
MTNPLSQFSTALAERAAGAALLIGAIKLLDGRHLTATLWRPDLLVVSEQALPSRAEFEVVLSGGASAKAMLAGRDAGTNVALLRLAQPVSFAVRPQVGPVLGSLVLAIGADGGGGATARLGLVNQAGPEWISSRGGRVDRRIVLDAHVARSEEGGPVIDANGALLGISTLGPRRQVLVIPAATIERVVPLLQSEGRVARGWLGVAVQPVAVPDALRDKAGQAHGFMVMSAVADGPAAKAGVVPGDIVVAIDGEPIRRYRKFAACLGPESIGRTTELSVIRGGAVVSVKATVTARPAA